MPPSLLVYDAFGSKTTGRCRNLPRGAYRNVFSSALGMVRQASVPARADGLGAVIGLLHKKNHRLISQQGSPFLGQAKQLFGP